MAQHCCDEEDYWSEWVALWAVSIWNVSPLRLASQAIHRLNIWVTFSAHQILHHCPIFVSLLLASATTSLVSLVFFNECWSDSRCSCNCVNEACATSSVSLQVCNIHDNTTSMKLSLVSNQSDQDGANMRISFEWKWRNAFVIENLTCRFQSVWSKRRANNNSRTNLDFKGRAYLAKPVPPAFVLASPVASSVSRAAFGGEFHRT